MDQSHNVSARNGGLGVCKESRNTGAGRPARLTRKSHHVVTSHSAPPGAVQRCGPGGAEAQVTIARRHHAFGDVAAGVHAAGGAGSVPSAGLPSDVRAMSRASDCFAAGYSVQ